MKYIELTNSISDEVEVDMQEAVQQTATSFLFEEIDQDILHLVQLGEHARVRKLSQQYHYYASHGTILAWLLENEEYDQAELYILDLLAGPFKHQLIMELETGTHTELLFLPRMLYLLQMVKSTLYVQDIDPLGRMLIDHYFKVCQSFNNFVERLEEKYNSLSSENMAIDCSRRLLEYTVLFHDKFTHYCKTNPYQFLYRDETSCHPHATELGLYEILDVCYTEKQPQPDSIIGVALNNVTEYIYGEMPKQYEQTLLKMDVQTLYGTIDDQEFMELSRKAQCYDCHLQLALDMYGKKNYSRSMEVLYAVIYNTSIGEVQSNFKNQERREIILKFGLHVLSHLSQEERDQYMPLFISFFDSQHALYVRAICEGEQCVLPESVNEATSLAQYLFNASQKVIY